MLPLQLPTMPRHLAARIEANIRVAQCFDRLSSRLHNSTSTATTRCTKIFTSPPVIVSTTSAVIVLTAFMQVFEYFVCGGQRVLQWLAHCPFKIALLVVCLDQAAYNGLMMRMMSALQWLLLPSLVLLPLGTMRLAHWRSCTRRTLGPMRRPSRSLRCLANSRLRKKP